MTEWALAHPYVTLWIELFLIFVFYLLCLEKLSQ